MATENGLNNTISDYFNSLVGTNGIKIDFKLGFSTMDIILMALAIFGAVLLALIIIHLMFPSK